MANSSVKRAGRGSAATGGALHCACTAQFCCGATVAALLYASWCGERRNRRVQQIRGGCCCCCSALAACTVKCVCQCVLACQQCSSVAAHAGIASPSPCGSARQWQCTHGPFTTETIIALRPSRLEVTRRALFGLYKHFVRKCSIIESLGPQTNSQCVIRFFLEEGYPYLRFLKTALARPQGRMFGWY